MPDCGTINGVGRYVAGPAVPYPVISVKKGLRYRFRLIQISRRPMFTFSIDGHTFDAMEFDGIEHDPVPAQNIDIFTDACHPLRELGRASY